MLEKDKQKKRKFEKNRQIAFWGVGGKKWILSKKHDLCLEGENRAFSSTICFGKMALSCFEKT